MNYQQFSNNRALAYPVSKPVQEVKRRSTQQLGCDYVDAVHIPCTLLPKKDVTMHTTDAGSQYVAPPVALYLRACREEFERSAKEDGLPSLQEMIDRANDLNRNGGENNKHKRDSISRLEYKARRDAKNRKSEVPEEPRRTERVCRPQPQYTSFDDFEYYDYGSDDDYDYDVTIEPFQYDPVTHTITSSTSKSLCVVARTEEERLDMYVPEQMVEDVCVSVGATDIIETVSGEEDVLSVPELQEPVSEVKTESEMGIAMTVCDPRTDDVMDNTVNARGGGRTTYRRGAFGAKRLLTSTLFLTFACGIMSQGHWVIPRGPRDRPKVPSGSYLDKYWDATNRFLYDPEMDVLLPISFDQSVYYEQ